VKKERDQQLDEDEEAYGFTEEASTIFGFG